ncbi:MAG: carboxypeptidase-like regulatory domain-containing protein [Saprospiraceae bacterium]
MLYFQRIRSFCAILGLILLNQLCKGQTLKGQVCDSAGTAIAYATVIVYNHVNDSIIAYTATNETGGFQLTASTKQVDSLWLSIRCLGFVSYSFPLEIDSLEKQLSIKLTPIGMPLREVVVRAEAMPVVVRSDTIEFNAASFSDSTEFSVEDLLKKLPGIQVNENGIITLNGQPVEKVMIEGDDLFGSNYQLATRNVRADNVARVQAIQHYQDNPLLKRFQESDRLVLNLVFKEEKKRTNSGSMVVGSGYGEELKGFLHVNFFSLSRQDKLYLIGNANNTGESNLSDITALGRGASSGNSSLQDSPLNPRSPIFVPSMSQNGLPAQFTNNNRSALLFAGQILPLSPLAKLRLSAWTGYEKQRQENQTDTHYLLAQEGLDLFESRRFGQKGTLFNGQAEAEWTAPDERHILRGFARFNSTPQEYRNSLDRRTISIEQRAATRQKDKSSNSLASFEYTMATDSTSTLSVSTKVADYQYNSDLFSDYQFYPAFFATDSSFSSLAQDAFYRQQAFKLNSRWLHRNGLFFFSLDAGYLLKKEQLISEFVLRSPDGENWQPGQEYFNSEVLSAQKWFSGATVSRQWGVIQARLRFQFSNIRLKATGLLSENYWAPEASASFRYTPDPLSNFDISYTYWRGLPSLSLIYQSYLFADYQTLSRGLPALNLRPEHHARVSYRFFNSVEQFSWNLSAAITSNPVDYSDHFTITPNLTIRDGLWPVSTSRLNFEGSISRFFPSISSRFEIGLGASQNLDQSQVNADQPARLDTRIYSGLFKYGTGFDGWLNLLLSNQLSVFHAVNPQGGNQQEVQTMNWFSTLTFLTRFSPKFDIKLNVYQASTLGTNRPTVTYWATDGVASLFLPKWRSYFQLSGFNLLNTRLFKQGFSDGFYQSSTGIVAVQPFFLFTWDHNF